MFNTERVMCWCLILEEFGPELKYIKGENNVAVNSLYWFDMSDNQEILKISELYWYDYKDMPDSAYSNFYHDIFKAQKTDSKQKRKLVSHKYYTLDTFRGGHQNYRLIYQNSKICFPMALQKKNVD